MAVKLVRMGKHYDLHRPLTGIALLTLIAGCKLPEEESPHCDSSLGTRAELTIPVGATAQPVIDEPVACGGTTARRVTVHAFGRRHFADAAGERVCSAPGDSSCRFVLRSSFRASLLSKLTPQRVGSSLECGDILAIHHWRDANAAVTVIDAELERWDVADNVDFAIELPECYVADDSAT